MYLCLLELALPNTNICRKMKKPEEASNHEFVDDIARKLCYDDPKKCADNAHQQKERDVCIYDSGIS